MMGERRAPGVQHGGEADAGSEMLGVGGDGGQRLGGGPEQEIVDRSLVLERDGSDRSRQGEDDMAVRSRQKLHLAVFEPLPRRRALTLRAVPVAAGVVGDAFVRTVLAALDMSAGSLTRSVCMPCDRLRDYQSRLPAEYRRFAAQLQPFLRPDARPIVAVRLPVGAPGLVPPCTSAGPAPPDLGTASRSASTSHSTAELRASVST
jgi:hypothetical protein